MDYFRKIIKGLSKTKNGSVPLPSRKEMFSELADRFSAGCSYSFSEVLPDPDPILAKLGRTEEVYKDIRADSKVAACIEQRKAGTASLNWGLESSNDNAQAAEIIEEALRNLDMPRIISEALDAVLYGFQPMEVLWEQRDGYILPRDVVGKPSHWFLFDSSNRLRFRAMGHFNGVELPQRKFILVQNQSSYLNPYGHKVLSLCFWPATFKKNGWRWWVTAVEKYGMPFIIGKVPRGTDSNEQSEYISQLENLVQDAIAVLPNDSQIEIMQGGSGNDSGRHHDLINQCNNEIALAILGQTLTSEVGEVGSYATSKTHNEVRGDIITSDKRMVEHAIQTLVNWTYSINWGSGKAPTFSMWHDLDVDKDLAERDKILSETGIRFSKGYYQRTYGLENEDFELVHAATEAEFAESERAIRTVKKPFNVDDYQLDGKGISEMGKALIGPIITLIDQGKDYEEVRAQLLRLYPKLDSKTLEDGLARAFYIAAVEGRLDG